jgi:hydroxyethylthiazole kinase
MRKKLWQHIQSVRQASPLVHNVTNFVVMNNTANALLAVGASPVMSHSHPEIREMVGLCQAVVINVGTLDEYFVTSMRLAAGAAGEGGKPWVLDPVGAGATAYRNASLGELTGYRPTVIRGNASEIMALAKCANGKTKGVDSVARSTDAITAARELHRQYGSVVCVSGETDIIVGEGGLTLIGNGDTMMTRVTGLGCSASAVIGAFIAVVDDKAEAVAAAMALFGICGELAARRSPGPGSLQVHLLDYLYGLTEEEFSGTLQLRTDA